MSDPFPSPYPTLLSDDYYLGLALEQARVDCAAAFPGIACPPISLVSINEGSGTMDFTHAGIQFGDMFFSGSLPKIAAMYAAFELRRAANFSSSLPAATAAQAFDNFRLEFDPLIDTASPIVSAAPTVTNDMRVPKYESVLAAISTDEGFAFDFNLAFWSNLWEAIVNSNNGAAGACVKALGYSWITGAVERGGFFYSPSQSGIWLCGTYNTGWPPVRVPCLNDGDTAQGMTCFDTANMYAHIMQDTLGSPAMDSSARMLDLLSQAASAEPSFLDWQRRPGSLSPKRYHVTHSKVGVGPRTNGIVLSEGTILTHSDTGRRFIVVFQNHPETAPREMPATLVDLALDYYLYAP